MSGDRQDFSTEALGAATSKEPRYAPLVQTLVGFFAAVDQQHRNEATDPEVRARLHAALDAILDGEVRFKIPEPIVDTPEPPDVP